MPVRVSIISMFVIFIFGLSARAQVTKSYMIKKLAGNSERSWFKKGSLAKKERTEGDFRYVFSRSEMKFIIYKCNNLLKWEKQEEYKWIIIPQTDEMPAGFKNWVLKINDSYCRFIFASDWKTLTLRLPKANEDITLE